MKTAQQRLLEIERKQILLIKKVRAEETRKTQKVGEYVREHMAHVEENPEFLAWLKTDIDKALFGVAIEKKDRTPRGEKPAKTPRPTFQAPKQPEVKVVEATATKAPSALPEAVQARVAALTKKPEPSPLTGLAGDRLRNKLNGQI
ncbi:MULTISPECIES: hypothetical protein [unclassified Limnobacter]|uniref:hypothetical protein n=1 Tax=unclassified Limnobacter TaxID=2630203 RepID=UPI000C65F5FB|nr:MULTISPECIES: hypothetical protein [unclassified Limnobacter]MAZ10995.1 hypothetical protein [Sutterellaceae bacterium]|tara:strand:- start:1220 stop:1657 length:438 start_codon:yes stop_codon:yes gene_type:complete